MKNEKLEKACVGFGWGREIECRNSSKRFYMPYSFHQIILSDDFIKYLSNNQIIERFRLTPVLRLEFLLEFLFESKSQGYIRCNRTFVCTPVIYRHILYVPINLSGRSDSSRPFWPVHQPHKHGYSYIHLSDPVQRWSADSIRFPAAPGTGR